jgi:UPF0271 protein
MRTIELSCDLGEASDPAGQRIEAAIWTMIDAANVACGGHAGDAASMRAAAARAAALSVILGAHPSYPDREGFGRRRIEIEDDRLRESLVQQIETLRALAAAEGAPLRRVKPHGALYNEAARDQRLASLVVDAIAAIDPSLAVVAQPDSELVAAARARGLNTVREAFADRGYAADGSLLPRTHPRALLLDPPAAAAQAVRLAREGSVDADRSAVIVDFETLCVHGDMEGAIERLSAIRRALGLPIPRG